MEIDCIKTSERNGVISITHISGRHRNGERWMLTEQEAVARQVSGAANFTFRRGGRIFGVSVGEAKGCKWLRSHHVPAQPDYLLSLPQCPECTGAEAEPLSV